MFLQSFWLYAFLSLLSIVNHSVAVPHHRLELQRLDSQVSHQDVRHERRPLDIRATPKPAKPLPNVQPSKPSPKPNTLPPNAVPSKPNNLTPPTTVKPLAFIKEPRPTVAYDICNLPDVDCGEEADGLAEALQRRKDDDDAGTSAEHEIQKRSSPRTYSVVVGGGTPTMMMTSLPYPLEAKLFPASGPKVILDFTTDNVRDATFKKFDATPQRTKPSTYIVEHIVELQSIMLFIKSATGNNKSKNGVQALSEKVDISFFTKHWGTSTPQIQQAISSRPNPFKGYNPKNALSSLNDVVFEAMGSKTNTADFVLCEEGVNAMKAKLWSHSNPFTASRWKDIAKDAADGSIPSNRHLAGMRSILGVLNYMNNPDVVKRLQDTVKNVKTEFSNFKHITGEDIKNVSGKPVDLPGLWVEFMNIQLQKVFQRGTTWIKDQVDDALPKYKAHLADLQKAMKRITDEEALKDSTKRQAAINKRTEEANDLIKKLPSDKAALSKAEKEFETASRALDLANAALKAATPATSPAARADRKNKLATKRTAERTYYNALRTKGRRDRDIIKLRRAELTSLIQDVEADIKQLTDYRAAAVAMKTPKPE